LSDFSFNEVLRRPRPTDVKKYDKNLYLIFKNIRGQLLHEEMRFLNTISTVRFFEIGTEYDINLGRHLNPELPPMRDFASRQAQLALFP
jgi:hypothetical protein